MGSSEPTPPLGCWLAFNAALPLLPREHQRRLMSEYFLELAALPRHLVEHEVLLSVPSWKRIFYPGDRMPHSEFLWYRGYRPEHPTAMGLLPASVMLGMIRHSVYLDSPNGAVFQVLRQLDLSHTARGSLLRKLQEGRETLDSAAWELGLALCGECEDEDPIALAIEFHKTVFPLEGPASTQRAAAAFSRCDLSNQVASLVVCDTLWSGGNKLDILSADYSRMSHAALSNPTRYRLKQNLEWCVSGMSAEDQSRASIRATESHSASPKSLLRFDGATESYSASPRSLLGFDGEIRAHVVNHGLRDGDAWEAALHAATPETSVVELLDLVETL